MRTVGVVRTARFHHAPEGVCPRGLRLHRPVDDYIATLPAEERALATHVLLGGFNERGKPVGFHHAPGGVCPSGRRIDEVLERYPDGSYRARVSFYDPARGWVRKNRRHTMFPDAWTAEQVMAAGTEAYRSRVEEVLTRWRGSARGVRLRGYHRRDGRGPATFFPYPDQ